MNKKQPYLTLIGLDANRKCNIDWSKYTPEVWHDGSIDQKVISYRDEKTLCQVRAETWDVYDCCQWYLLNVHGIKDNVRDGENISLRWE